MTPIMRDAINFLDYDFQYPNIGRYGHSISVSADILDTGQLNKNFYTTEELVECAARMNTLPYLIDKNSDGSNLKEQNPLGKLFYSWVSSFPINFNCKYEVDENTKLLLYIASKLDLWRFSFYGNPNNLIDRDLREGELINTFIIQLQKKLKSKSFQTKKEEREEEANQAFAKSERYINKLYSYYHNSYGVRMVLVTGKSVSLKTSDLHFKEFLNWLEFKPLVYGGQIGWWWKREYMSEVGYFYYLIIFFRECK